MVNYIWHNDDYNKRIINTINGDLVGEDLTNFPALVTLSGTNYDDLFEELLISGSISYATWNISDKTADVALSGGDLIATFSTTGYGGVRSTISKTTGKWYFEFVRTGTIEAGWGISKAAAPFTWYVGYDTNGWGYYVGGGSNGRKVHANSFTEIGTYFATTDTISIAFDADAGKFWIAKNGTWLASGDPANGTNPLFTHTDISGGVFAHVAAYYDSTFTANFGASEFSYSVPSGFNAGLYEITITHNKQKIAIYDSNSNQCYTEIESWDSINEVAYLWAKIPALSSGINSNLYLYYDNTAADNTTYIGETGSSAAQNVWSGYSAVYHMAQDPSGGTNCILDSTSNTLNGTTYGSMTASDLVEGNIGKAIDFDGSNDHIIIPHNTVFDFGTSDFTINFWFKVTTLATRTLLAKYSAWTGAVAFDIELFSNGTIRFIAGNGAAIIITTTFPTILTNTWYYFTAYRNGGVTKIYINGVYNGTHSGSVDILNSANLYIARDMESGGYLPGSISGIRIAKGMYSSYSKIVTELSLSTLVNFSTTEVKPAFVFGGEVKLAGQSVARTVYVYKRDTGELYDTLISNSGTGHFEFTSSSDVYYFINIMPEIGDGYNILSYDQIKPV